MSDSFDVIQAFVDDEPVDPAELERALADPDGRAHLIDIVVLRNLARQSVPSMPSQFSFAAQRPRRARWLSAAAVIALATGLGGYLAGGRAAKPQTAATDETAPAATGGAATAPAPAYVIRLEPGVDWTERTGGR